MDEFAATLARASGGDADAFAMLWRVFQPRLLRYLSVCAPAGAAEDLASETWLQVVKGLASFAGDEPAFTAWLFTIARHRSVDYARRLTRRPETTVESVADFADGIISDAADAVIEADSTAQALALIATLPPEQAEIVTLRVVAGLDVEAVAELLGKSPGAVRVAAHRGLRRLAATLEARAEAVTR
ncbi:MAG: RNA polymerase sigma factor [Mycobacteriales bacterium]